MKTVPFSGIVLETSNPQDGQLTHMVNLRHTTTGSVEPVGDNPKVYTMHDGRELLYIHKGNGYENWISYDGSTIYYEAYRYGDDTTVRPMYANDHDPSAIGVPIYTIKSRIFSCTSAGNTLVIATQSEGLLYFLCSLYEGDEKYVYNFATIRESDINVDVYSNYGVNEREYGPFQMSGKIVGSTRPNITWLNPAGFQTDEFVINKIQELKNGGFLTNDIILARWAIKMYDGYYIYHSAPILLMVNKPLQFKWVGIVEEQQGENLYDTYLKTRDYTISIKMDIPEILYNSDIYKSIDLFISIVKYYPNIDVYQNNRLMKNEYAEAFYINIDKNTLNERLSQTSIFYKLAEYKFEEFEKVDGVYTKTDNPLLGKSISEISDIFNNLVNQPILEDDNNSRSTDIPNGIFLYNNKMHLYNLNTKLYEGYSIKMFLSPIVNNDKFIIQYSIKTYIKTTLGDSIVVKTESFNRNDAIAANYLSNYISYPDSRAYKMEISIIYDSGRINYLYSAVFDLKPHDFLNLSYFIPEEANIPIEIIGTEQSDLPVAPQPSNDIDSTPNKIKVSATDNPFIFPVEQTYTIGNGKIIGMAAASPALSQGQYGQFPLYVFTDEGIYMMQTGSGEVVYTNVFTVSRDVCDNPDSILSLDNAVMFSSNNKIFILSGYSAKPISDPLEAEYISNPGNLLNLYGNIISPYTKYAYNYQFAEIIVTPEESHISLVYDLKHKIWRERILIPNEYTIGQFVHSYPVAYAIDDHDYNVYDLSIEEKNSDKFKNIAIQTAPIVLGNTGFKKIERSVLRAIASGNITITIYASNDNISFYKMVAITVNTHNLVHDIPIPRIPSSWRYYYLCIEGDMGFESTIIRWDIQEKTTFNTKLR